MSLEMKVPAVGESISEVTIATWLKNDGDAVALDEILCELESDKATFELRAEKAGILKRLANDGDTLQIGAPICLIEEGNAPAAETKAPATKEQTAGPQLTGKVLEMKVPTVGESITEVTLGTWSKKDGDFVAFEEVLCEIESDKATFELTAEAQGILRIVAKAGDTLPIGALVCKIEVSEGAAPAAKPTADAPKSQAPVGDKNYAAGHPSPAADKLLKEKGVNPADVNGSGPGGRITKEDAMKAEKKQAAPAAEKQAAAAPVAGARNQRREKMTNLRKTISRRLVEAKNETAMLTTFNEINMGPVMELRKKYKDKFKEKHGVNLGFMSFFTKACCMALQEWPAVNAYIDGDEIIYNDYCDVSIAVSSPRGLVVPVIRNAEQLSFDGVESEVVRLALKARDNKLSIDEMTGGTFTITNGGIFGSMLSTPIINRPQSAILGMHNIVERPVAVNGEVKIAPVMYVALSYDHRIIDGRESVSFLYRVKELIEDPTRLLLGV